MEEEAQQESIIDMLFSLLEQLLLPDWSDLIALLPWVLIGLIVLFALFTAWQWRRAGARNRPRVAPRLHGGAPPPGVHLPGPSRWPFVVPIGAALLLFAIALPARDDSGAVILPFNLPLAIAGIVVSLIAIGGWLLETMREWRSTAQAEHVVPGHMAPPALAEGRSEAGAVQPVGQTAVVAVEQASVTEPEVAREPPPGVHLPGPSPWPFFAPIAFTVMLFGVVFSPVLLIGGIVLGVIAAIGWYLDAGHEYFSTESVGHAVPRTRDPSRVWPRRLVPVFGAVIAISLLVTLAPVGLGWLNSLTPAEATPTPISVPAVPEISASNAISFETDTLIVPAGRPFELVFNNDDPGVPHNVEIADTSARANVFLDGEVIDGVATITYQVPALAEGDYYFLCAIHPNMNGTVRALPENGAPAGGPSAAPQASPAS